MLQFSLQDLVNLLSLFVRFDVCAFWNVTVSSSRGEAPSAVRALDIVGSVRWGRRRQIRNLSPCFDVFRCGLSGSDGFDKGFVLLTPIRFLYVTLKISKR